MKRKNFLKPPKSPAQPERGRNLEASSGYRSEQRGQLVDLSGSNQNENALVITPASRGPMTHLIELGMIRTGNITGNILAAKYDQVNNTLPTLLKTD